jgi:hypothetical protein
VDKETIERINAAPDEILVSVTQKHIDQCSGRFDMINNAIALALEELGWTEVSISMFSAYIGHPGCQVGYKPETKTSAQIELARAGQPMTPFIAGFKKEKYGR